MHMHIVCSKILTDTWNVVISKSCCCLTKAWTNKKNTAPQGPPTDAPAVDTAEQVYISSLALLKVTPLHHIISSKYVMSIKKNISMTFHAIPQMLKHGRAGVPMEVMGLMLGEFVDDYTVRVIDVFAMPQSGTVSSFVPISSCRLPRSAQLDNKHLVCIMIWPILK